MLCFSLGLNAAGTVALLPQWDKSEKQLWCENKKIFRLKLALGGMSSTVRRGKDGFHS